MLSRNLWKLILSATLALWAIYTLLPLKDQDFGNYLTAEA
jgi:SecD/SecF fusion protein